MSLISFTARAVTNQAVELDWETGMEQNNAYFLLEHSKDLMTFESVTKVSAREGQPNQRHTYQYTDENPYMGTSYYRLSQVDLNGKTTAYPAVSVILRTEAYGIFPNPVINGKFTVNLDEPQTAVVTLYNLGGSVLPLQKTGSSEGALHLKTSQGLSTGVYILTVAERGQIRKYQFIIE